MLVLTVKTDQPEAEVGLYEDDKQLAAESWQAHRELSATIHRKIADTLKGCKKDWADIGGVVCFKGPGSFTGLRIGLTVGNALAASLKIPIVSTSGPDWVKDGLKRLAKGQNEKIALPEYGALPHITQPRK